MCFHPSVLCLLLLQGSSAMCQILVQKQGALLHMPHLLKSPNQSLQKTAISLLGNMSRTSSLQTPMGKKKHEMLRYFFRRQQMHECRVIPHKPNLLYVPFVFSVAKQILPELTSLVSSGPREMGNSDETIATACSTLRSLMLADTEVSKKFVKSELVSSVADLSENR